MSQEFYSPVFGDAAGRDIHNHYSGTPCPGPNGCPHRLPPEGSSDAKEENEFFNDTGIRAGPDGRRLLKEFQARHGIRWRGRGGMLQLWRHRRVEYLDGSASLRVNYSRWNEWYGWFIVLLGALLCLLATVGMMFGKASSEPLLLLYAPLGLGMMWFGFEHMVEPDATARKLRQKNTEPSTDAVLKASA